MTGWGWRDCGFCVLVMWSAFAWRDFGGCRAGADYDPMRDTSAQMGGYQAVPGRWEHRLSCPTFGLDVELKEDLATNEMSSHGRGGMVGATIYLARGKDGRRYQAPVAACVVVQTWVRP